MRENIPNKNADKEELKRKIPTMSKKVYGNTAQGAEKTPVCENKTNNREMKQKDAVANSKPASATNDGKESFLYKVGRVAGRVYFKLKSPKAIKKAAKAEKKEPHNLTIALNSKRALKVFTVLFLLILIVLLGTLIYLYRPFPYDDGIPSNVTVYYTFDGESRVKDVGGEVVFRDNGEIYVNLSEIYPNLGMSAIGDSDEMKYIIPGGEYMILKNESALINMNGEEVTLPGRIYIEKQNVFVPVALLQYYTSGVDISYNTELERLTISRVLDKDKSNSVKNVYIEFDFLLHKFMPLEPIPEPEI